MRRQESGALSDERSRAMPEMYWFTIVGNLFGAVALIPLSLMPGIFAAGPFPQALAIAPGFAAFAVAVALAGRLTQSMVVMQAVYAIFALTYLGLLADNPAITIILVSAVSVAPLGIVTTHRATAALSVTGLCGLSAALMVLVIDAGLVVRGLAAGIILVLSVMPALTVLAFRRRLQQAIHESHSLATTDPLTGLMNRRGLAERIPQLLTEVARDGAVLAVLVADLDHFKAINDRHGHAGGDDVLRRVAEVITASVRSTDPVARIGGEEFCVVTVLDSAAGLHSFGERIRRAVEAQGGPWHVTVSIGGVPSPKTVDQGGPVEEMIWAMIDQADAYLYEAKRAGRNTVRVPA